MKMYYGLPQSNLNSEGKANEFFRILVPYNWRNTCELSFFTVWLFKSWSSVLWRRQHTASQH